MRMRGLILAAVTLALLSSTGGPAEALVLTLDCVVTGNDTCTASATYGTITIVEDASDATKLDVTIDLAGTGQTFQDLLLNFDPVLDDTGWTVNGLTTGFAVSEDGLTLPPLNSFNFDISPDTDTNVAEPQTYVIAKTGTDLDPSDFDFAASFGGTDLFAAVHIQNCGPDTGTCEPGQTGTNSIKVGALTDNGIPPTEVPEPATLFLLGSSLLGAAAAGGIYRRLTK